MVLSKREKHVAIAVAVVVGLLGIYSFIVTPYLATLDSLQKSTEKARNDYRDGQDLIARQKRLQPVWRDLQAGGLNSDDSLAQNTASRAFSAWARFANVSFDSYRAERSTPQGPFQTMGFNLDFAVSEKDSVRPVTQFLWAAETATIPMRINKVIISSVKEGTENLSVKVNLSTLYMPGGQPSGPAAAPAPSGAF